MGGVKKDDEEKNVINTKCLDISLYSAFKYICMCECALYIYKYIHNAHVHTDMLYLTFLQWKNRMSFNVIWTNKHFSFPANF